MGPPAYGGMPGPGGYPPPGMQPSSMPGGYPAPGIIPGPGGPYSGYPPAPGWPGATAPAVKKPPMALIALVVVVVAGGLFYFGGASTSPEQVVTRYLDGWTSLDLEKVMGTVKPALRETMRPKVDADMTRLRQRAITTVADNRTLRVESKQKEECLVLATYLRTRSQGGQSEKKQIEERYHMVLVDRQWYINAIR